LTQPDRPVDIGPNLCRVEDPNGTVEFSLGVYQLFRNLGDA